MMKPTVGRKVWFWSRKPTGEHEQPFDATVLFVHSDQCVNLFVVDHLGAQRTETSVMLYEQHPVGDGAVRYATWMPYQVGQAKRYEAKSE